LQFKTYSTMVVGADMPAYRMVLILIAFLFVSHRASNQEDEEKLTRPEMNFSNSALQVLIYLVLGVIVGVVAERFFAGGWGGLLTISSVLLFYLLCVLINRRSLAIWLIRFYQYRAPADVRVKCVLMPSCSEYMIIAITKYGLVEGFRKGIDRLRRCGPPVQIDYP